MSNEPIPFDLLDYYNMQDKRYKLGLPSVKKDLKLRGENKNKNILKTIKTLSDICNYTSFDHRSLLNQQIKLSQILKSYLLSNYGNYEESKLVKNVDGYEQIFTVIEKNNEPVPKSFSRNGTALKLSFKDMIENIWSENDIKNVLKLIITDINFKTNGYRSRMATREMLEFQNITSNTVKFTNILIDYTIKKYYRETLNHIYNYSFDSNNKKIQNIIKTQEFSIFKILNTTNEFNNFKALFITYINEKYNLKPGMKLYNIKFLTRVFDECYSYLWETNNDVVMCFNENVININLSTSANIDSFLELVFNLSKYGSPLGNMISKQTIDKILLYTCQKYRKKICIYLHTEFKSMLE